MLGHKDNTGITACSRQHGDPAQPSVIAGAAPRCSTRSPMHSGPPSWRAVRPSSRPRSCSAAIISCSSRYLAFARKSPAGAMGSWRRRRWRKANCRARSQRTRVARGGFEHWNACGCHCAKLTRTVGPRRALQPRPPARRPPTLRAFYPASRPRGHRRCARRFPHPHPEQSTSCRLKTSTALSDTPPAARPLSPSRSDAPAHRACTVRLRLSAAGGGGGPGDRLRLLAPPADAPGPALKLAPPRLAGLEATSA